MSRAIPLLGVHVCTSWCWETDCPNQRLRPLTRKQRRWIRRQAAKDERRRRRREHRRGC